MGNEMFNNLLGKVVKIDRGGPESRIGQLVTVKGDYFTLLTVEDGLVFYQSRHTKSITQTIDRELGFYSDFLNRFRFIPPRDFRGVLNSLRNFNVKINRGGPESVEGILMDVNCDFVTVMTRGELIRVALFHIRNISLNSKRQEESSSSSSSSSSKHRSKSRRR